MRCSRVQPGGRYGGMKGGNNMKKCAQAATGPTAFSEFSG